MRSKLHTCFLALLLLAAPPALAPGPDLKPAAYKPLPAGTVIRYDDRKFEIEAIDGNVTTFASSKKDPRCGAGTSFPSFLSFHRSRPPAPVSSSLPTKESHPR